MKTRLLLIALLLIGTRAFAQEVLPNNSLQGVRVTDIDGTAVYPGSKGSNSVRVTCPDNTVDCFSTINNGTVNVTGGGVDIIDGGSFVEGTTHVNQMGGVRNDTEGAPVGEDKAAALRLSPHRAVHAELRNDAGTEVGTSGAPLRVDVTGSTTQPVSGTVSNNPVPLTSVVTAQLAITASPQQLGNNAGKNVCLKVVDTGSVTVFLGASGVSISTGWPLEPGATVCLPYDNSNRIYSVASGTGSTLAYWVLN